jgi:hypothetical protein
MTISSEKLDKEQQRRKLALQKRYVLRITIARQGREAFSQRDFVTAAGKYNEYLRILSEMNEQEDIFKLSPTMFDDKSEITEMLLISHIFWELGRINEMTPKLQAAYQMCLNQFVKFTINQPYQVLNAEMLRKYIKKNKTTSNQIELLNAAYQQIFVESQKCFVSTLCYGSQHPITRDLREYKTILLRTNFGRKLVELYYRVSSRLVAFLEKHKSLRKVFITLARPILTILAKISNLSIMK